MDSKQQHDLEPPTTVQFADRSPSIIPSPVYNSPAPSSVYPSISSSSSSTPPPPPSASHVTRTTVSGSLHRGNFASDTFKQDKVLYDDQPVFGQQRMMEDDDFDDIHEMHTRGGGTGRSFGQDKGFMPLSTNDDNEQHLPHNNNNNNNSSLQRGMMDPMNGPSMYGSRRSPLKRLLLGPNQRPWFSWISAIIMLVILIYELIRNQSLTGSVIQTSPNFNPMIGPSFYTLIDLGAKFTPCMRAIPNFSPTTSFQNCYRTGETCSLETLCGFGGFNGANPDQSFRFFYPIFMHAGIVHFLLNMLTHLRLGVDLERALGMPRYVLLYIAAGLFGNVLSAMLARPTQASMGASGALFGLIGYMFVDVLVNWKVIPNPMRELMGLLISTIISLVLGLLPGLDNFAHLGGFVVGLVMGMMIAPMRPMSSTRGKWITWGLRGLALVIIIILFVVCITSFYNSPDPSQICPGCKYLSCLPVNNWCDY
ncbi:rhomboid family-domain-containing protein [Halteromyces radiatus]|uniref:rhomboid family-domain-containing protein n=1 Tax=Halteromyces radiatus TaxID=101107 RepID=UPI00221EDAEB|nr:rhomboid family-domain-containing protein [Halteromyces radiatus]KAI8093838.1 rhomboid family-domain-containing protein [Halteromyces radiatus]